MGVFEQAKGKVKEAAGEAVGNPDLKREGEAQAAKGAEQRKETQAQAEAQLHEKKAELYEKEQKAAES